MGFTLINKLPTPVEIREQFPLDQKLTQIKQQRDEDVKKVFTGESDKFIVIIGPCSADNEESVCDYTGRLVEVQEKTKDKLIIIPRIYTNRSRATGEGYVGMVHQPDPEKKPDMFEGVLATRHMYMRALRETGPATADEMPYSDNLNYLSDMIVYVVVGARSVENQYHRLVAGGCNVPVGMKNPTNDDLIVILSSVVAVQLPYDFIPRDNEVQCPRNLLTHTILRGAVNKRGQCIPNYHYEDLKLLFDLYAKRDLKNPACIADTNHSNSNKQYKEQTRISREMLHSRCHSSDIKRLIKGLMIESYIEPDSQKIGQHRYGQSVTDPCLGWEDSERLLYEITDNLGQAGNHS